MTKKSVWPKAFGLGLAGGVLATLAIGFTWGGWTTAGTAAKQAESAVSAALVSVCVRDASDDPALTEKLAAIKDGRWSERDENVIAAGWATFPGADEDIARDCAEKLLDA